MTPTRKAGKQELPLVPLRELVIFPHMVVPFFVGRPGSIRAVEDAMNGDRLIFLACQKKDVDDPKEEEIYPAGTVGRILQMLRLPDGNVRVLAQGEERGIIQRYLHANNAFHVQIKVIEERREITPQVTALMESVHEAFKRYAKFQKKIPPEAITAIERAEFADKLVDLICANIPLKVAKKVELLQIEETAERLEAIAVTLESENELLALQNKINLKVKKRLEKNQKDYFLTEQLKEINRELGRDDGDASGAQELEKRIREKNPPQEVLDKSLKECRRLSKLQPMSPESGVLRTYLEWIADLPWHDASDDNRDIDLAARILDEDHYDMKKPKERILDFIAVHQLKERMKGPILCFVGPPGTGKTSLGKSVARALGRQFVRVSLGGVRDEAEIRGHRKTYVGALPGKILQSMKKSGTVNPVFLLDEVDKISSDFRGDPASALLEVLDPEQNNSFMDHYLEVPYDLSHVLFITTANSAFTIPHPLRDRMEIIEIPGYTEFEKLKIATDFIIPKQLLENGLEWADVRFRRDAILKIIRGYTMESGVRSLEREIAGVIRKIAREAIRKGFTSPPSGSGPQTAPAEAADAPQGAPQAVEFSASPTPIETERHEVRKAGVPSNTEEDTADGSEAPVAEAPGQDDEETGGPTDGNHAHRGAQPYAPSPARGPFATVVTPSSIVRYLGNPKFQGDIVYREPRAGLAHGLAWTELGGTLLPVEVAVLDGPGDLILTGSLGEVMKESARTALSFLRVHYRRFKLPADFQKDKDIHIHVPEGAIPKDGPSAGITLAAALLSAFSGEPIKQGYAMTGEITLTGRLLPIGGVKEKVLAAHRNRMHTVLMPEANRKDIEELPREVLASMKFVFAGNALEALLALFSEPL